MCQHDVRYTLDLLTGRAIFPAGCLIALLFGVEKNTAHEEGGAGRGGGGTLSMIKDRHFDRVVCHIMRNDR